MKFHHIGIACFDISATAAKYEELGYSAGSIIIDPIQNVKICFLDNNEGLPCIELLAPVDETSPVNGTLSKNGVGPYHTCFVVKDINKSIKDFKREKYVVVSSPIEACAIEGRKVAFLYNKDMGLIELVEG